MKPSSQSFKPTNQPFNQQPSFQQHNHLSTNEQLNTTNFNSSTQLTIYQSIHSSSNPATNNHPMMKLLNNYYYCDIISSFGLKIGLSIGSFILSAIFGLFRNELAFHVFKHWGYTYLYLSIK